MANEIGNYECFSPKAKEMFLAAVETRVEKLEAAEEELRNLGADSAAEELRADIALSHRFLAELQQAPSCSL